MSRPFTANWRVPTPTMTEVYSPAPAIPEVPGFPDEATFRELVLGTVVLERETLSRVLGFEKELLARTVELRESIERQTEWEQVVEKQVIFRNETLSDSIEKQAHSIEKLTEGQQIQQAMLSVITNRLTELHEAELARTEREAQVWSHRFRVWIAKNIFRKKE